MRHRGKRSRTDSSTRIRAASDASASEEGAGEGNDARLRARAGRGARALAVPLEIELELRRDRPAYVLGACELTCAEGTCEVSGYALRAGETATARSAPTCGSACAATTTDRAVIRARSAARGGAYGVFELLRADECARRGVGVTTIPRDWAARAESAALAATRGDATALAVFGPKGVGKSTLARHCANGIVRARGACAWLDLDCGQPELTAPGMVSLTILRAPLLGPPQTHQASGAEYAGAPSAPLYAGFVGDVSPQGDPEAYVRGAVACVRAWADLGEDKPPLVVNTSGWVKGLGLELAEEILREVGRHCSECHAVNINSHVASRNVPDGVKWFIDEDAAPGTNPTVHAYEVAAASAPAPRSVEIETEETSVDTFDVANATASEEAVKTKDPRRTANDSRALSWLAWARQIIAVCGDKPHEGALDLDAFEGENEAFAVTAAELMAVAPWRVAFADVTLCVPRNDLTAREALAAFNGAVVGLLRAPRPSSRGGDAHAECVGLGIVRGVDVETGAFHVLAPCPRSRLRDVAAFALGSLELPRALVGPNGESPYMTVGAIANDGTGSRNIGPGRRDVLRQNAATTPR